MPYRQGVTGGPFALRIAGMVRQNSRGLCPVCGVRHAVCDNPAQPEMLYPAVDTRNMQVRPELRFKGEPTEPRNTMPLVQSRDFSVVRRQEDMTGYVSDKRLYLNDKGEVVEDKDASAVKLLVAAGGVVPYTQAMELGLMSEEDARRASMPNERKAEDAPAHGPGPDDPGAFYDDGTPATPAGNEGFSDVKSPRQNERHFGAASEQQYRGAERPERIVPPASQDKTQAMTPEEQEAEEARAARQREMDEETARKSREPAEDKARSAPETKAKANPRNGGSR